MQRQLRKPTCAEQEVRCSLTVTSSRVDRSSNLSIAIARRWPLVVGCTRRQSLRVLRIWYVLRRRRGVLHRAHIIWHVDVAMRLETGNRIVLRWNSRLRVVLPILSLGK